MDYRDFFIPLAIFAVGLLTQLNSWLFNSDPKRQHLGKVGPWPGTVVCGLAGGWAGWITISYWFQRWVMHYDPIKYGGWVIWGASIALGIYLAGRVAWFYGPKLAQESKSEKPSGGKPDEKSGEKEGAKADQTANDQT